MDIPRCECHGEGMLWNKDTRYAAGGFWRCRVKNSERNARWYTPEYGWRRYIGSERPRTLLRQREQVVADLERLSR